MLLVVMVFAIAAIFAAALGYGKMRENAAETARVVFGASVICFIVFFLPGC